MHECQRTWPPGNAYDQSESTIWRGLIARCCFVVLFFLLQEFAGIKTCFAFTITSRDQDMFLLCFAQNLQGSRHVFFVNQNLQGSRHAFLTRTCRDQDMVFLLCFNQNLQGSRHVFFLTRTCRDQDMLFVYHNLQGSRHVVLFLPELAGIKTCFSVPDLAAIKTYFFYHNLQGSRHGCVSSFNQNLQGSRHACFYQTLQGSRHVKRKEKGTCRDQDMFC